MFQDQEASKDSRSEAARDEMQAGSRTGEGVLLHAAGAADAFESLADVFTPGAVRAVSTLGAVADSLANDPGAQAVVIYPDPVMVLGERLQAGNDLTAAIVAWSEDAERLLKVFRRDRRRVTLLDGHAALAAPALLNRLLSARVPGALVEPPGEATNADTAPAGLPHLIAAQALRQNEKAAMLAAELEASSLPLGPAYRIPVDELVEEWKAVSSAAGSPAAEEALQREKELLLGQLGSVQEKLEQHGREHRDTSTRLDALEEEAEQARAAAKKARLARKSLQQEFNEARSDWSEDRKALTEKLKWTADDLAAMRRSLSWKLTAPLRRVAGLFSGGSKL